jgi:hypothetical protein
MQGFQEQAISSLWNYITPTISCGIRRVTYKNKDDCGSAYNDIANEMVEIDCVAWKYINNKSKSMRSRHSCTYGFISLSRHTLTNATNKLIPLITSWKLEFYHQGM